MPRYLRGVLIGMLALTAAQAFADELEEQDPVRVAQKLKDCFAENVAKHDGRSAAAIRKACKKAVADGSYSDPNISLDGMIKQPQQQ
jgi:cytochrome c-type biogenesis protein CcmH/NrfF